ncbi:MAG TPA: hypothetical protein PKK31_05970 [Elusimicrobiales bacterium]|nr:hypothetical protein [Elusimicrobiales bacterium]
MRNKRLIPAAACLVVFIFMLQACVKAFLDVSLIDAPAYVWAIAAALTGLAGTFFKRLFDAWPSPMPLGRAYAAAYALLPVFLLSVLFEMGGGFTDGGPTSFNPPGFIAALASAQFYLVGYIWLTVFRTGDLHPRQWLRIILHFLYTAPFLVNVVWFAYFVEDGLTHKPGSRHTNGLIFIVAANILFSLWLLKNSSTKPDSGPKSPKLD